MPKLDAVVEPGVTNVRCVGAAALAAAGPEQTVTVLASQRWVRAIRDGRPLADTRQAQLMLTSGPGVRRPPVYAIPRRDTAADRLISRGGGRCPVAGPFTVFALADPSGLIADAAFACDAPPPSLAALTDHVMFVWAAAESWWEEDEQIFVHPTDPFHRVDAVAARRHVMVRLGEEVLADCGRPTMVFETGLPPRAYLPAGDVRMDLLTPNERRTRCPVKGLARYWDARLGAETVCDVAWSYPFPVPQLPAIAQLICFDPDRVEVLFDDRSGGV